MEPNMTSEGTYRMSQESSAEHSDPLIGRAIEGYKFLDVLGKGGFGAVYLARHPRIPSDVAVKYVRFNDIEEIASVKREIQILAALNHPNVVRIYDAYTFENYQLIMMELIRGGSLRDALRSLPPGQRLDRQTILDGIADVARALDYVHNQGILHLDLKPENILLNPLTENEPPRFVLTDFGISQVTKASGNATARGGTPRYMSPEHFGFGEGKTDRRSDVYSLGVILYELVAGQLPFDADTLGQLLIQHKEEQPPQLPAAANVSPDLEDIILRALEKDPQDRFQTAGELYQALSGLNTTALHQTMPMGGMSLAQFAIEKQQSLSMRKPTVLNENEDQVQATQVVRFGITILKPDGTEEIAVFNQDQVVLGRSKTADHTLADKGISRQHLFLEYDATQDMIYVSDLGSSNGTYLNGERLEPEVRTAWHQGQYVTVQGFTLVRRDITNPTRNPFQQTPDARVPAVPTTISGSQLAKLLDEVEAAAAIPRVMLRVTPEILYMEAGKPQSIQVIVNTQHTPSAFYELQVSGTNITSQWYQLPAGRVIEGGQSTVFEMGITAPRDATSGGRTYEMVIELHTDHPAIPPAFQVIKVTLMRQMHFMVSLHPGEFIHGRFRKKASELIIRNNGNYDEDFSIHVEGAEDLRAQAAQTQVQVAAGAQQRVPILFNPTRSARSAGRLLYRVSVVTQSGSAEEARGSYVYRNSTRRIAPLSLLFTLVLIAIMLAVLGQFLGLPVQDWAQDGLQALQRLIE